MKQDKDLPLNGADTVRLLFPNDYVAADDLHGADRTVTISRVTLRDLQIAGGNESERKPVLHFAEAKKKLVMNKTNATTIAEMHGPLVTEWVGKRITLYATTCMAFGRQVDCIRIRETVPDAGAEAPPDMEDEPAAATT